MTNKTTNNLRDLYEGAEIFITGGSGIVGKAYIECLLRLCNVRCIYILLRPKKNATIEERLAKICKNLIFQRLKEEKPNELNKLIPIHGDALLPNLGVTPEEAKKLENVSLMYHCAATIRFDEPLKVALQLNVGGTLEAINLAKTLRKLKLFMHVSTFYSNTYVHDVEPKIYSSPMDWKFCLNLVKQNYNEDILNCLMKKLITGFPNTYCFTKNLAESLVNDFRHELPVAVVRPSIVLFALKDPKPGFPPALSGAMGLFASVAGGLLKTVYIGDNVSLDITPQDVCVKYMAYYTHKAIENNKCRQLPSAPVYNFSCHKVYDRTFRETAEALDTHNLWHEYGLQKSLLFPGVIYTSNHFLYMFIFFMKQLSTALLVDGILLLCGRKPAIMALMRKIFVTLEVMQPFMFNNYTCLKTEFDDYFEYTRGTPFSAEKELKLASEQYVEVSRNMVASLREIAFREDPKTIPQTKRIQKMKLILYYALCTYIVYKLISWMYSAFFMKYL